MPGRVPYHKPAHSGATKRAYERTPSRQEDKDFYSSTRWMKLRDLVRAEEPVCRACKAKGFVEPTHAVDHVVDRKERPDLAYERENLQGLCRQCHNAKRGKA